jgi:putative PIN family toxin of toxin-antitoxin system
MLSAAVDTNVKISGMLSEHASSASAELLDALKHRKFELFESQDSLAELRLVAHFIASRAPYSWTHDRIDKFCNVITDLGEIVEVKPIASASIARDVTDTKFLNLALASNADYLVTNDRRHLLRLKLIGHTMIVTPHKFILALRRDSGTLK